MPISNETPRGAVEEIIAAINARDYDRLTARVDLTSFVNIAYDDAIDQLALNCDRFHEKYPGDLLFQFGAQALRDYNARYRLIHIGVIFSVIQKYFYEEPTLPKKFSADPISYGAFHLKKLIESATAEIVAEDWKSVTVELRAALIGVLRLELETATIDGRWRVMKISNAAELVEPIVDIAEKIWPREWDRGIVL